MEQSLPNSIYATHLFAWCKSERDPWETTLIAWVGNIIRNRAIYGACLRWRQMGFGMIRKHRSHDPQGFFMTKILTIQSAYFDPSPSALSCSYHWESMLDISVELVLSEMGLFMFCQYRLNDMGSMWWHVNVSWWVLIWCSFKLIVRLIVSWHLQCGTGSQKYS